MDKVELINKEIKELKVYLTNLYGRKKEYELKNIDKVEKDRLNYEITTITDIIDNLKKLKIVKKELNKRKIIFVFLFFFYLKCF